MLYGLFSQLRLPDSTRYQFSHLLSAVEDSDGLLVLVPIDLYLVYQLLVDEFVLAYENKKSIKFCVQFLVIVYPNEVLFS